MANVDVLNQNKSKVGSVELRDDVFKVKVNVALVHQVLKAQMAGWRQGTAKTKTRAEVQGGGKKPYRQKGTGNARAGSIRSPLFVGGGQNFGPTPRSYEQKTPKEMVRGALRSVLSDRLASERFMVIDEFKLEKPKTKILNDILSKKLGLEKALIVDAGNEAVERSGQNIPHMKVLRAEALNVYDVLKHEWLVITKGALESIQERLTPQSMEKKQAKPAAKTGPKTGKKSS